MTERTPREIKQREKPVILTLYITFWLSIVIMFIFLIVNQAGSYNVLRAELDMINANIERERFENERLQLQYTFFDEDAYIEQLARHTRGMVRPNEIVFKNMAE
ncbi:MAG: septum formation initiator family protein [Defluviitaleaceae bacterium]|nr:septum formation initiator family protein [Defluviitaleaceae bacterium]